MRFDKSSEKANGVVSNSLLKHGKRCLLTCAHQERLSSPVPRHFPGSASNPHFDPEASGAIHAWSLLSRAGVSKELPPLHLEELKAKEKETSILDFNIFNPIANLKQKLYNEEHLLCIIITLYSETHMLFCV